MANVSRAAGFRPVAHLNGSAWNGQTEKFYIPASDTDNIYQGDPVKLAGGSDADGVRTVAKAAAGDATVGVVVGFSVDPTNLNTPQYRVGSTARYALVVTSTDTVFEGQVSGTFAVTDIGLNIDIVASTGSTSTGVSNATFDGSTKATTSTLAFKTVGFSTRQDNEPGNANAKILAVLNKSQLANATAGV